LSYNGSAYKTFNKSSGQQETTNAFIGLTTGANIGGWQFRHNGQWQWQDNKESEKKAQITKLSVAMPNVLFQIIVAFSL
jgi:outer membrane usher protein